MDSLLLKALILGVVEGLTEFLPISSTGHLILAGDLLDFNDERAKVFEIVIQTAAMLAIILEYRVKFIGVVCGLASERTAQRFVLNLFVAFVPAAVLGLAFSKIIKTYLFKPVPVALAFIIGAFVILWVERRQKSASGIPREPRISRVEDMSWRDALKVGFAQAFALIPGTSRSGATIIGGMIFGLSRKAATEFSFFLAVPTLLAAGAYDFWKHRSLFSADDLQLFGVGMAASFVSAFLCVRWLLRYIATHDFSIFAWYRIAFGVVVLVTAYGGLVNWTVS